MLSSVLASSAVALAALLIAAPAHVDALVTPLGGGSQLGHLAARHLAGVSPNHNALARRKRNVHKNRKRCQQRPTSSPSPTPAPQPTNGNNNPPVTTTTTTQSTYTPPSNNNGNGKLLLAWPNSDDPGIPTSYYFTGKASRYYTWSPSKVQNTGNVGFCAMLWGDNQIDSFTQLVVPGYTDCVLGMNEPNQAGQSDMDIYHGAWLWNTYIGGLQSQGYNILGSPAPTSAPDGLTWINGWLDLITVKPTVMCLHWYDVGFPTFQTYVTNYHNGLSLQRNIWITEFACENFNGGAQCSEGDIWSFVQLATQWMDGIDWIEMYAPFGFMEKMQGVNDLDRLINYDGTPTALGSFFINNS